MNALQSQVSLLKVCFPPICFLQRFVLNTHVSSGLFSIGTPRYSFSSLYLTFFPQIYTKSTYFGLFSLGLQPSPAFTILIYFLFPTGVCGFIAMEPKTKKYFCMFRDLILSRSVSLWSSFSQGTKCDMP